MQHVNVYFGCLSLNFHKALNLKHSFKTQPLGWNTALLFIIVAIKECDQRPKLQTYGIILMTSETWLIWLPIGDGLCIWHHEYDYLGLEFWRKPSHKQVYYLVYIFCKGEGDWPILQVLGAIFECLWEFLKDNIWCKKHDFFQWQASLLEEDEGIKIGCHHPPSISPIVIPEEESYPIITFFTKWIPWALI